MSPNSRGSRDSLALRPKLYLGLRLRSEQDRDRDYRRGGETVAGAGEPRKPRL